MVAARVSAQTQVQSVTGLAAAVGSDCTSDMCATNGRGCASCVELTISLQPNAWVDSLRCYTTANYPNDSAIHEVGCGTDVAWSTFDTPLVVATAEKVLAKTTYHNRSSNRPRSVRLDVQWHPLEAKDLTAAPPVTLEPAPANVGGVSASRELVDDVLWSVEHEGCGVFSKDQMRAVADLQKCYATTQRTPDASLLIKQATAKQIADATSLALFRSYDEYRIQENFEWVMSHEGQKSRFTDLAAGGQVAEIRRVYRNLQSHNDMARNALSALTDSEINNLVEGRGVTAITATGDHVVPATLVDYVQWALVHGGCEAFAGESIRAPNELQRCYSTVAAKNHNGSALSELTNATPAGVATATGRAITKVKNRFPISGMLDKFLLDTGEVGHFKSLVQSGAFAEVRRIYSTSPRADSSAPFVLNTLADSEIAAIVNRSHLDVVIPLDMSPERLKFLADLLEPQKARVTAQTTVSSLAETVCQGKERSILLSQTCELYVTRAVTEQGLKIEPNGVVSGGATVSLPELPRLGVPTLVSFRPGVSAETAAAALASTGAKVAQPAVVRLILPEHGATLAASTIQKYGNGGIEWYAWAISADKIRASDLKLTSPARVAVIDAGVDTSHAKLKPFFWKLPVTLPNVPWERGSIGYDYVNRSADPMEDTTPQTDGDLESHGTHVTGLVALRGLAEWLPAIASIKLEQYVQVYSLKIAAGAKGVIPDFTVPVQALHDSLPNQIHIFNLSLEGPSFPMIRDDIKVHTADALLVLAAGNDATDLNKSENLHVNGAFRNDDGTPLENVIFVAALTDVSPPPLTPDSNKGDLAIQIAAPGNNIWSTVQGGGFGAITGTSQAAPLVTATAAILLAEHQAFPSEIKERILATCDWDDSLRRQHLVAEGCRLNMAKAIVATTDIVELSSQNTQDPPRWLRGLVERGSIQLKTVAGKVVDPATIQRIFFPDHSGTVRIAIQGGGHRSATLLSSNILVTLDAGETCPRNSDPCQLRTNELQDIVFRW
jgi:hypothetical protein